MNWQLVLVALCVGVSALYVARQTWRTWAGKKSGCGGCGCGKTKPETAAPRIIPVEELTWRRRAHS